MFSGCGWHFLTSLHLSDMSDLRLTATNRDIFRNFQTTSACWVQSVVYAKVVIGVADADCKFANSPCSGSLPLMSRYYDSASPRLTKKREKQLMLILIAYAY